MSDYDRRSSSERLRSDGGYEGRDNSFNRFEGNRSGSDYRNSDYRNRANMSGDSWSSAQRDRNRDDRYYDQNRDRPNRDRYESDRDRHDRNILTRSVDEVRSWFGDDEAERRRIRDEEERRRHDQIGAYHNHTYIEDDRSDDRDRSRRSRYVRGDGDWDSSRGYGSNIDRDYGRSDRWSSQYRRDESEPGFFRSSNEYGGSRNRDFYRNYPTHNTGRSAQNNEDDEMKHGYESQFDYHQANALPSPRHFGGREYDRNYPTRAERNNEEHAHDFSEGWQSSDSHRGYRSLNNTGRTGIAQENQLGRDRDSSPNYRDRNYSHGDYTPNLNAGGEEYNSRHYEQQGRPGTPINEFAQRGYSQGYGRSGYSLSQPGIYGAAEVQSGKHPKNYKGTDDRIYVEVCEALGRELDASNIEVKAFGNEITLAGTVRTREEKRRAERIAEGVHGVEDVHNQLTVSPESSTTQSPETRSASQQGNSSRTDLAGEGSSPTEGSSPRSASEGKTSGANGSAKGTSRK